MEKWYLLIFLSVFFGILRDFVSKKTTQKMLPLQSLQLMYIAALLTTLTISLLFKNTNPFVGNVSLWYPRIFGFFFGIGVYAYFEAIKISLSKTQIWGSLNNIVGIILSLIFLKEYSIFNFETYSGWFLLLGTLLFVFSIILGLFKERNQKRNETNITFFVWILLYSIFVGTGLFFVKLFSKDLDPVTILFNQYIGSFVVIILISIIKRVKFQKFNNGFLLGLVNGVLTSLSLVFLYEATKISTVTIITSLTSLLRIAVVIPIGIFVFKEYKSFSRVDVISMMIGFLGVVFILFA